MENKSKKPRVTTKKHVARLEKEQQQVRLVRTVVYAMFGVIALLLFYGYIDINYLQLQKPVAEVNGEKISIEHWQERVQLQRVNLANVYQRYQFFQQQFGMDVSQQIQEVEYYLNSPEATGQLVLDQMVDEILISQEAERRGITVSDEEIEQAIKEVYRFFPDGTPVPTITPTAFEYPTLTSQQLTIYPPTATPTQVLTSTPEPTSTPDPSVTAITTSTVAPATPTSVPEDVTPTATPYTLEGFNTEYQATVEEYKTYGISEATFREAYKNDLLRKKLQEAITADVQSTEEQVWARHILVGTEAEAKAVTELLKNGTDFAKLAGQFSTDTGSGAVGGDLGWFGRGAMVSEFEDAAFSQPIGEIGEPVQTQFGYHIIQVLDRQELPLDASQLQQARDNAFTEWLTTTKDESDVTTDDVWMQHIPDMPAFGA
jgi:parvulin-like peptidyl-prolyl isomerase